ncbi:MAG: hypothetical protein ABIJ53_01250 [Verrucomicrobiota bacterium]
MKIVRKIMKWLGIGIGSLLVLGILASLVMNVVFGHELRQTLAKLRVEGRPWFVVDIRPAPVPEDQNAAPLITKAITLITNAPAASAIKELSDLIASNKTDISTGDFLVNGRYNAVLDISVWPTAHREKLPHVIQAPEMQALFTILHEASQKTGYNCNLKYEDGAGMFLPNLGSFRTMIRFMCVKAELAAHIVNGAEASATVLEGLKLANLLKQEPTLIHLLVSTACDALVIDCLEQISNGMDIPTDKAQALITELSQHTDTQPWIRAMDGERMFGFWCYQTIQHGSFHDFSALIASEMGVPKYIYWIWKSGLLKKDFAYYLAKLSQIQDYYKVPYYQVAATIREHPIQTKKIPYIFTGLLLMSEQIVTKKAEHDAIVDVARVGLALKLFEQKNGAYPDTLDKLATEFLDAIPVDPFTGKALIYRKADAGFILYSLGPNQQDDNGTPKPIGKNVTGSEPYDIAWKCAK